MWPLGPNRGDAIAWALAIVVAVAGTAIAAAAGARLGAALTLGGGLLVAVVVTSLLLDARGRTFDDPGDGA